MLAGESKAGTLRLVRGTEADIPRMLTCAPEFAGGIPDHPLDQEHYRKCWEGFFQAGNGAMYLLEEVQDGGATEVAGGIGGICHPDLLTGRLTAVELFWYVKLEHRTGDWPVRLLKAFEDWAATMRCHDAVMVRIECPMNEWLKEFYQRRGYTLFETMYRKVIGGER
jgi:hypothetical protein